MSADTITLDRRNGIVASVFDPADTEHFARCWRGAWKRLPLYVRRSILGHWRRIDFRETPAFVESAVKCGVGPASIHFPNIELIEHCSDFYRGNSGDAWAQCRRGGDRLLFRPSLLSLDDEDVIATIAHELCHVFGFADGWESHVDGADFDREIDVESALQQWGFHNRLDGDLFPDAPPATAEA